MRSLFRNRYFLFGFLFISCLVVMSFTYSVYLYKIIPDPPKLLYGEHKRLLDVPPYPPSWSYLFGVDRYGGDVFWKVIDGAKYTIFTAIIVSFFRVGIGLVGGLLYSFYLNRAHFVIEPFVRAFRFVPAVLLTLFFFISIPREDVSVHLLQIQLFVLVIVGLPPLISLVKNEVSVYRKNEFITSSRIMGGSNFWLMKKHILPHLRPRLLLFYLQQIVQTLLLLVHLGTFHILLGGVKVITQFNGIESVQVPVLSLSNEWSGLIGLSYRELMLDKWILIGPCIGFILSILSFKLILKGIEQTLNKKGSIKSGNVTVEVKKKDTNHQKKFDFVH